METVKMSLKDLRALIGKSSELEDKLHDCPVFSSQTEFPNYNELLSKKEARITHMSPEQYLMECKMVQGCEENLNEYLKKATKPELVDKYVESMKKGEKFPLPFIDYSLRMQEGRHRVLAAEKYGLTLIPVVIIR